MGNGQIRLNKFQRFSVHCVQEKKGDGARFEAEERKIWEEEEFT